MTQPGKWKDAGEALNNDELVGCHMPDGPGVSTTVPNGGYLQYNEVSSTTGFLPPKLTSCDLQYIVYEPAQIRLKYLLMVRM